MSFLFTSAALLIAFMLVVGAGAPLIARVAEAQLHQRTYDAMHRPHRPAHALITTTMKPFVLAADPMCWPSEAERTKPWVDRLSWPSARWGDDDVFGRGATAAAERARELAEQARERASAARRNRAAQALRNVPGKASAGPTPGPSWTEPPSVVDVVPAPVSPPAPRPERLDRLRQAEVDAPPSPVGAPSAEEIRALVRERGLADAVRTLMERTGMSLDEVTDLVVRQR